MNNLPGRLASLITILISILMTCLPAHAAVVSLAPDADTYIEVGDSDNQLANHGSDPTLALSKFSIFSDLDLLIRFDLSSIPSGATINSATLSLFEATNPFSPTGDIWDLANVTSNWDENTVSGFSPLSTGSPVMVNGATSPVIDVTNFVIDWVNNGVNNYGLWISTNNPNSFGNFHSRESLTGTIPSLDINFTTAVPIPAAIWLFGSGLVGLIGISRRKKAA